MNSRRSNGPPGPRRKVVIAPPGSAGRGAGSGGGEGARPPAHRQPEQRQPQQRRPQRSPQQPVYIQRRHKPPPQGAAKRPQGGPALAAARASGTDSKPRRSLAVVIITRNAEAVIAERIKAWRDEQPGLGTQWLVLDLGSTDGTLAALESLRVQLVSMPGGRVRLLEAMDRAMAANDADVVLFADALALPSSVGDDLVDRANRGAALAVAGGERTGILTVPRAAWQQGGFAGSFDLLHWARDKGWVAELGGADADLGDVAGTCLPLAVRRAPRRPLAMAAWRMRRWLDGYL